MRKRALGGALAIALTLGLISGTALAVEEKNGEEIATSVDQQTEETLRAEEGKKETKEYETGQEDIALFADTESEMAEESGPSLGFPLEGSLGENVQYSYDRETGVLTISGSGKMRDFGENEYEEIPWESKPFGNRIITEVIVKEGVTNIGNWVFGGSEALTKVTIPESVTTIGESAFRSCVALVNVTIPESATTIGENAFCDCHSLEGITIPESVTSIGKGAFEGCWSLSSISIPQIIEHIENRTFFDCQKLRSVIVPEGVTSIGEEAFASCDSLENIDIPESVVSIGPSAFENCYTLKSVSLPTGLITLGASAFQWASGLVSIDIPQGITTIADGTFFECKSLAKVTIPEGVRNIERRAFAGCQALSNVDIPSSVTSIGDEAFDLCGLKNVVIPETISSLGTRAFGYIYDGFIWEQDYKLVDGYVIYGKPGSTAEKYATDNNIDFVAIQNYSGMGADKRFEYVVVPEASDLTYILQSGDSITIYSTGRLEDFRRLWVDGAVVDASNYTLKEGSTVLTLLSTYLDTLSPGRHSASLEYTNGVANATINILKKGTGSGGGSSTGSSTPGAGNLEPETNGRTDITSSGTPLTGDHSNASLWRVLIGLSLFNCVVAIRGFKRLNL